MSDTKVSPLPRRLLDTVFSPGKMVAEVAEHPRWLGALLVSIVLVTASTALIPPEILAEVQRRAALERGVEMPELSDRVLTVIRIFSIVGPLLGFTVVAFLMSGIYTVIFAFVLGDEGAFNQYLAIFAHASFVSAAMTLPLTPLRIATRNPQFNLSVGSFFVFLEPGYVLNVLRMLDLTQIWAALIVAMGAHAIDRRRSFGSAAAILLSLTLIVALVLGRLLPTTS